VKIQLIQGDNVVDEITLDGEPDDGVTETGTETGEYVAWLGRFKAVDKYNEHGAPIEYTVSEVTTGDWQSSVSGNARTGFTVENVPLSATSATLSATKTVNGGEVGSNTFSFELYEGSGTTGTLLQTVQNDHDGAVTFDPIVYTTSGTRTYTIVEKDEGTTDVTYDSSVYTVIVNVANADGDSNLDSPTITYYKNGQQVSSAVFDNTVVTRTSVAFTKEWVGNAGASATVRLMCSTDGGQPVDTGLSVTVDGTKDSLTTDSTTGAMYGEDAAWHGMFQNLVASNRDHTYTYTLVEDDVDGYESSVSGDASKGYVFTNTELASVSVSKVWDDADDQDGLRPDSVTVQLYANGTASGDAVVLNSDNGWSNTWVNLDKYANDQQIIYSVEETSVPSGYTASYSGDASSGFTITNTHTPETTSVSVTKAWDDSDNQDGLRPDSVTVQLYANGSPSGEAVVLNSDNSWTSAWGNLNKYANGQQITYSVEETSVPSGYTASYSGDASSGFTITNTHTPETTSVTVTKSWNDGNNADGLRPNSVTIQLYADGEASGDAVTLSSSNSWTYTSSGLDTYADGEAIEYTVEETGTIANYTTDITGDASSGFTVTNTETLTVHVQKNWTSYSNEASIVVQLYSNSKATGSKLTLVRDENDTVNYGWNGDFSNLPKYDSNGEKIEYTVVEEEVYWPNDSTNYRNSYGCTPTYTTSGNTINCALWNVFGGSGG
jgi:pilin isopeptide linkage protein